MVIRDAGGGRHRSAAMASSSSAYRSATGSKSIKTTDTRSTRLVRVTQTGLKKTRRSGKAKSEGEQATKSILMKKKSGGLLRRKGTKTVHSVTFKDEAANGHGNFDDYSTIASERTYSSAESSRSGSTKSLRSRVRSPHRRQPTLDPIEEGGETPTQERDPPEPAKSPGSDDAFFHLGALPAIKGWSPQDFSMPTFHDATRNMNSWLNAHTSSNRAVNEAVPLIVPCSAAAAAASIVPSPTNANDRPKELISTPSYTSSVGLNVENEVVAASAPTTSTAQEERKAITPPNTVPTGKPPLHPTSAPRCPPSPTRSIVTPAEPKYGNFQPDESASLQESIEVSEATPKAGNAVTYHSSPGISLSSRSGTSDATPTMESTPLVIEVPSIIISNESNSEGGDLDAVEVASIPSLGGSSDAMSNASNQNLQNSSPSLGEEPSAHSDQGSDASHAPTDNTPPDVQSSKTSVSGDGGESLASSSMSVEEKISPSKKNSVPHSVTESVNTVEERAKTRAPSKEAMGVYGLQTNENEEPSSTGPENTMEIIEQMDKTSRQNQHKRSVSLPKYFDRFQQYASTTAAVESKVRNEPTKSGHATSGTIAPIGENNNSAAIAQVIKEAKETSAESIINIHVHLNSNEVRPVTNVTSSAAPAVVEAPLSSKREATCSEEKKNDEEKAAVATGDISRKEHNEADQIQTAVEKVKVTEVAQIEIAESVEMDMDELALLSTRQCIMECRDPLSSQNPDPVIKKLRRKPRKSAGCSTILSNGAAKCIRHCAEGVDETHSCQLFSNMFSCVNETDALGDIDWDSDKSDDSSAQHRERQVKRSKHKKKKKHRPTREKREKEEDSSVVFDSGGLSFRLAVDLPGSDEFSNDGSSQDDDECRHREDHESRDSNWEQDTIVMRRHDSSSIDSEDYNKSRTTRESRHSSKQRQRHRRHKKSSSSHPDRRSRSRSRSASRSKREKSPSRSRSRSKPKSCARKEKGRKDSNASASAHRHHRRPQEENVDTTHNRKLPPVKPSALDERPLSPKRKRSMKDRMRNRSHSRR